MTPEQITRVERMRDEIRITTARWRHMYRDAPKDQRSRVERDAKENDFDADALTALLGAARTPCPHVVTDAEGTSHCALAERPRLPHMCRDGHLEVRYSDDGRGIIEGGCPACERDALLKAAPRLTEAEREALNHRRDVLRLELRQAELVAKLHGQTGDEKQRVAAQMQIAPLAAELSGLDHLLGEEMP